MVGELSKVYNLKEFDNHKLVCFIGNQKTGLYGFISIHRGNLKTPAFGATRIWNYSSPREALIDSLRLSKTMSHKAALAGLNCGGAKATIVTPNNERNKKELLKSYARKVNYLSGHFITGADVGVSREDVIYMRRYSPYMVGVMSDPVRFTSQGILLAIRTCLKEIFGSESIVGRKFAIQGIGKIGKELLKNIYPFTQDITVSDVNLSAVSVVKSMYPKIKVVEPLEIHKQEVDVFSPCALSNCLNSKSIRELKCAIVAGGANNQLEGNKNAEELQKRSILYAPDYVINAGGLISVYDEYEYKNSRVRRVEKRVEIIKKNMEKIIKISKRSGKNPADVADQLARKIFDNLN